MKISVCVTAELDKEMLEPLTSVFDFKYYGFGYNHEMISEEQLIEACKDSDILVSEFDTISDNVLSNSTVKLIICCRSGVNTVVDLDSAKRHGVIVCNNVGRNKESTAEFTVCLILDLLRHVSVTNAMIHGGPERLSSLIRPMPSNYGDSLWGLDSKSPYVIYRGQSIKDVTIGIIGFGQVGQTVYDLLSSMGAKCIVCSRSIINNKEIKQVDLKTLLRNSDVVTLHISGNKDKKPLLTYSEMSIMKKSAFLVNTSRGYNICQEDLIKALKNGVIRGAALDVLVEEPIGIDDPLLKMENCIITPHIAGSSNDTIKHGTEMVINALIGYARGDVPNRVV